MRLKCKGKTKTGHPCPNPGTHSGFCFTHDPARVRERAEARRLGGYNRRAPHGAVDPASLPGKIRTLDDVLAVLDYALAEAVPLENSINRGRLLIALGQAFADVIKDGELERRLAAIEDALKIGERHDATN